MTKHAADTNRRRFVKLTVTGLAATPFASALFSGSAEAVDTVSESDPTATALKYKTDATKATDRKDTTALCSNCNFYSGKPGDANGPCAVFGGKLVREGFWRASYIRSDFGRILHGIPISQIRVCRAKTLDLYCNSELV